MPGLDATSCGSTGHRALLSFHRIPPHHQYQLTLLRCYCCTNSSLELTSESEQQTAPVSHARQHFVRSFQQGLLAARFAAGLGPWQGSRRGAFARPPCCPCWLSWNWLLQVRRRNPGFVSHAQSLARRTCPRRPRICTACSGNQDSLHVHSSRTAQQQTSLSSESHHSMLYHQGRKALPGAKMTWVPRACWTP